MEYRNKASFLGNGCLVDIKFNGENVHYICRGGGSIILGNGVRDEEVTLEAITTKKDLLCQDCCAENHRL